MHSRRSMRPGSIRSVASILTAQRRCRGWSPLWGPCSKGEASCAPHLQPPPACVLIADKRRSWAFAAPPLAAERRPTSCGTCRRSRRQRVYQQ
jgi:hypothetical protein